jgi:branched-subunit amino acid transport protein
VTGLHLAAVIGVVAAGVVLPKAVPAAVLGARPGRRGQRFLDLLPAALLGGLAMVSALGGQTWARLSPAVPLAVAAAAATAALTRRPLPSMAVGWAVLVGGLLAGLG